ncbi:MAG: glycosyltransferase family 2 protein [Gammaproteobacteria bacterium]
MNLSRLPPKLAIIVPCYQEELVVGETIRQLHAVLQTLIQQQAISSDSFLYFVDDGSQDATWQIIQQHHLQNPQIKGLRLSRNFGHQSALLAGLLSNKDQVDCALSIDADLQQDVQAIPQFIERYREGYDIVLGIRRHRRSESWFKRSFSSAFYRVMRWCGVKIIPDHPDYRLMSQQILQTLADYPETNLFLRALCLELGFKTTTVYYDQHPRFAGTTKYPLRKMLSFAWNGISAFSIAPLRFVTVIGCLLFLFSLLCLGYVILDKIFGSGVVPGWASITVPIYLLGGVQIFCIGVLGEYIGKIYHETKRRPRYIKKEELI